MIENFKHKGLRKYFEEGKRTGIKLTHAKRIRLILIRLNVSCSHEDMDLPGFNLHLLKGKWNGFYSVTVNKNGSMLNRVGKLY